MTSSQKNEVLDISGRYGESRSYFLFSRKVIINSSRDVYARAGEEERESITRAPDVIFYTMYGVRIIIHDVIDFSDQIYQR